jgi:Tfp pilus assembly protein PilX
MNDDLATQIQRENALEDAGVLRPDNRTTCYTHQCLAADCAAQPGHVNASVAMAALAARI